MNQIRFEGSVSHGYTLNRQHRFPHKLASLLDCPVIFYYGIKTQGGQDFSIGTFLINIPHKAGYNLSHMKTSLPINVLVNFHKVPVLIFIKIFVIYKSYLE